MTRREQRGRGQCGRWDELFATPDAGWRELLGDEKASPEDWRMLARRGGFPTPALELSKASDRRIWFGGCVRTCLERDLQDLAAISGFPDFRQLMRVACLRLGQLVHQAELGRDVALAQTTVHGRLNLLETSYLLVRLPAYAVNRTRCLIKAPKIHWGDTGIAMHLADTEEPAGAYLENLVLHDLLAWRGAEYGKKARAGLLLHKGNAIDWLAPDVLATSWWMVLQGYG